MHQAIAMLAMRFRILSLTLAGMFGYKPLVSRHLQIKECKLTGAASMLVDKVASKVAAKDSAKVVVRNLSSSMSVPCLI